MEDIKLDTKTGQVTIGPDFDEHLGRNILRSMKEYENRTYQIDCVSGERETYGSVRSRSIRVASHLKSRGLRVGDVVLICAVNHLDCCIPFLASQFIGTIPVCLVVGMTHSECQHLIGLAQPKIIFTDPEMTSVIKDVLSILTSDAEIVVFGESDDFTQFSAFTETIQNENEFTCVDFDTKKTIAYASCSSGTTGLPKLVAISHSATVIGSAFNKTYFGLADKTNNEDGQLAFSSMYWMSGVYYVINTCLSGKCRIISSKPFSFEIMKDALEKYKPTTTFLGPILIHTLLKHSELKQMDFSSLKTVVCAGSNLDPETFSKLQNLLPNGKLVYGYGISEVGTISIHLSSVRGSVGKPIPWLKWKVVDVDTEEVLGPNQPGELRVQSITQFTEYLNDKESTKAAFDSENFYKTGDLVYYDEDKNFFLIDRIKEVIKYQNFQIATAEIENVLCTLPEVLSAAVVGVPNNEDGELPMAFVQKVEGSKITAKEIKEVVKDKLSDYKQLRGGVVFLDKIPMTYSGKIDRRALRVLKTTIKDECKL